MPSSTARARDDGNVVPAGMRPERIAVLRDRSIAPRRGPERRSSKMASTTGPAILAGTGSSIGPVLVPQYRYGTGSVSPFLLHHRLARGLPELRGASTARARIEHRPPHPGAGLHA